MQKAIRLFQVFCAGLILTGVAFGAGSVTVMTRNVDAGTDFGFFFANFQTDPSLGAQLSLNEFQKNDFLGRTLALGKEIGAARPVIVGLQEVTLLATGPDIFHTNNVVLDQLQLLLGVLAAQGTPYQLVAANTLTDLPIQLSANSAFRFTDRDAVIARADLLPAALGIGNVQTHHYATLLTLGGLAIARGWISADVSVDGNAFRFVTTHLESSGGLYGNPAVDFIQAAQAQELATTLAGSPIPVVIAGDLNSNATHTPVEQTPSYGIILSAGYLDAWSTTNHGNPGFTWPLYLEDPLRAHTKGPREGIDCVFARGLTPRSAVRTGLKPPFVSDHAGVVVTFDF